MQLKSKLITLHALSGDSGQPHAAWLDKHLLQALKIPVGRTIALAVGSERQQALFRPSERKGILALPSSILARFGMHSGLKIRIHFEQDSQTVRLGPLFALLLANGARPHTATPFGEMSAFCRELALAARREGVWLVVTAPSGFRLTEKRLTGWTLRRSWTRIRGPLPDVLYNRLQNRKAERRALAQHLLKTIKNHAKTAIFNEQFLDKITVFAALAKDANNRHYLPQSVAFKKAEQLKAMLARYPVVFIKPASGSMGRGIIRIIRKTNDTFEIRTSLGGGSQRTVFTEFRKLLAFVRARVGKKAYLLQQGLTLLTVNGRNVDFRALVQKDRLGRWGITSIVARVAGPRHFVSNLARGGRLTSVQDALRRAGIGVAKGKQLARELRRSALMVAQALEQQLDKQKTGMLGELGVDLALDRNQQIWLLEVNSKPAKTDPLPEGSQKIRPSARKAVQYARFLGNF